MHFIIQRHDINQVERSKDIGGWRRAWGGDRPVQQESDNTLHS